MTPYNRSVFIASLCLFLFTLLPPVSPVAAAPENDSCTNATVVDSGHYEGTLEQAGRDGAAGCGMPQPSEYPDVWYRYTAPDDGKLWANTCGTSDMGGQDEGIDTVLSIHRDCPGTVESQLACNDDWNLEGGEPPGACEGIDQGRLFDSAVGAMVAAGQTVVIRVSRAGESYEGPFLLNVAFTGVCRADLDHDGDVDGRDLYAFTGDAERIAGEFGRNDCP